MWQRSGDIPIGLRVAFEPTFYPPGQLELIFLCCDCIWQKENLKDFQEIIQTSHTM